MSYHYTIACADCEEVDSVPDDDRSSIRRSAGGVALMASSRTGKFLCDHEHHTLVLVGENSTLAETLHWLGESL